jgi:Serine/Threonine/Tyrosine Kinase found in polyvalent proteins
VKNQLKYELQHLIFGNERLRQGSVIQTVAYYLSRSKGASATTQTTEFDKREEEKQLIGFIEQNQLWVTVPDESYYLSEGAEQKVYLLYEENSVLKLNTSIFYALWIDYFYSLLLHNFFFKNTPYTLIGFTHIENQLCAVVKQPFIRITEPTDLANVCSFLGANGFRNTRNNDYHNATLGIILEDLHDENVLVNEGVLFVIDSVFYLTEAFYEGFEG